MLLSLVTVKLDNNKYFRLKEENPSLELSVAPTRHWDTCGSNPGVGGIFSFLWLFSVTPYCLLGQLQFLDLQFQFSRLG